MIAGSVYLLCAVTSLVCMLLLGYGFFRTRSRLLFWSALCFVGLAVNNALLFIDLVILPSTIDLQLPRLLASGIGMALLIYGFIWDVE
jgi:hypothetical protein